MSFLDDLFEPFWTQIHSNLSNQQVVAVENGVNIVKRLLGNGVMWPGEKGHNEILIRPVYDQAWNDIRIGLTADQLFYYLIEGSSGMGKTQFIGYLIECLVNYAAIPTPTFRVHYSNDPDMSDIWLHYINNVPTVTISNSSPLQDTLPTYFISDTYPRQRKMASRLHLHIMSIGSKDVLYEHFVKSSGHRWESICFPPFSRIEHLACLGHWVTRLEYITAINMLRKREIDRAMAAVGPAPLAPSVEGNRSWQAYRQSYQTYQNRMNVARQEVFAKYYYERSSAFLMCFKAGRNPLDGVWSNWEALQCAYDIFGGCIRLLRLPSSVTHSGEDELMARSLIEAYLNTVRSVRGGNITIQYSTLLDECSVTLVFALNLIKIEARKSTNQSAVRGRFRSMLHHTIRDGHRTWQVPASKFMQYFVAQIAKDFHSDFHVLSLLI